LTVLQSLTRKSCVYETKAAYSNRFAALISYRPPRRLAPCRLDTGDMLIGPVVETASDTAAETQQLSYAGWPTPHPSVIFVHVELLGHGRQLMTGRLATHLCNNGGTGCLYPSVNCNPLNSTTSICCGFVCGRPTTCFCSCA